MFAAILALQAFVSEETIRAKACIDLAKDDQEQRRCIMDSIYRCMEAGARPYCGFPETEDKDE